LRNGLKPNRAVYADNIAQRHQGALRRAAFHQRAGSDEELARAIAANSISMAQLKPNGDITGDIRECPRNPDLRPDRIDRGIALLLSIKCDEAQGNDWTEAIGATGASMLSRQGRLVLERKTPPAATADFMVAT
jgi:hypothetical protein